MPIKGFKGFDKDLRCRGFQYEVGKEYETDDARACQTGFHFCENPLDTFNYYPPGQSRYGDVEGDGKLDYHDQDSKIACTKIRIGAEIGLSGMIKAAVQFIFDKSEKQNVTTEDKKFAATTGEGANAATTGEGANAATTGEGANAATTGEGANAATTGEGANAATTGSWANAATTGEGANAATTGYRANASALGEHAIAAGLGINNKAKAALGNWIVLAEWVDSGDHYEVKTVKSAKVDGKKIKANVWYKMNDGKFVEAEV
jgi:hypothetical protein